MADEGKDRKKQESSEKYDPASIEPKWLHSASHVAKAMRDEKATRGKQSNDKYEPTLIEPYWQSIWDREKTYQPNLDTAGAAVSGTERKRFYNLMMFPYPSAEGLHVGNMYAFTGADVFGRFQRMQGHEVFEPIGLDGFGIHSENYALKIGSHPMEQVEVSEKNYYRQLHSIGNSYDWRHTVETYKPDYYRWTQWVFTELFKAGLAYRAAAEVNWCPSCKTVLADEQVVQKLKSNVILNLFQDPKEGDSGQGQNDGGSEMSIGVCERCETPVEKRSLEQWFFRITGYSERLLQDLEKIEWTEKVKIAQRNWIGKSEGAKIRFAVILSESEGSHKDSSASPQNDKFLDVFTTRPDTLHGATFMVVSPEHPLVAELLSSKFKVQSSKLEEVEAYVKKAKAKSDKERRDVKEKKGVFSGMYAINPVNNQQIPIWIADYVLMGYGTGAIMAVPAHDLRDFEFAKKYGLEIKDVILRPNPHQGDFIPKIHRINREVSGEVLDSASPLSNNKQAYSGPGKVINSGEWDGWETPEAKKLATEWLEERGIGKREVTYHLRDWLISRQRYWGAPIPMIYCENCAGEGKSWFTTNRHSGKAPLWCKRSASGISAEEFDNEILNQVQDDKWESAGWYVEENLPVILPKIDDYRPVGTGKSPLANHPEFYETTCPECGSPARRETDVADTFLDSSWYFLRYLATEFEHVPFPMSKDVISNVVRDLEGISPRDARRNDKVVEEIESAEKRVAWLPVNQYTGGAEHSVLHLLYARFVYKVFTDLGYINTDSGGDQPASLREALLAGEPFPKFYAHGLIIKEGAKMSKSKGNVVVPDVYIKKYGADTLRTYLMFLGPYSEGGDFQDAGIDGVHRFLKRVWRLMVKSIDQQNAEPRGSQTQNHADTKILPSPEGEGQGEGNSVVPRTVQHSSASLSAMHRAIKGVGDDMSSFRYNTAIAKIMTWYNALSARENITPEEVEVFLKLLAPFAPHMTEELFQRLKNQEVRLKMSSENLTSSVLPLTTFTSIHTSPWPEYDEAELVDQNVIIAIQVNGKLRDTLTLQRAESKEQRVVEEKAKESENVKRFLVGKEIKKVIYVPGKILNLVVS